MLELGSGTAIVCLGGVMSSVNSVSNHFVNMLYGKECLGCGHCSEKLICFGRGFVGFGSKQC